MAAYAASRRSRGGASEVATIIVVRAMPAGQIVLDELPYLPPAFPDEAHHRDVAPGAPGQHAEQRGFADARAGHEAQALPGRHGAKQVERAHAQIEEPTQPSPAYRGRRLRLDRIGASPRPGCRLLIRRAPKRIKNAAKPGVGGCQGRTCEPGIDMGEGARPWPDPVNRSQWHDLGGPAFKANDFRRLIPLLRPDHQPVTDTGVIAETGDLQPQARYPGDAADRGQRRFGTQALGRKARPVRDPFTSHIKTIEQLSFTIRKI